MAVPEKGGFRKKKKLTKISDRIATITTAIVPGGGLTDKTVDNKFFYEVAYVKLRRCSNAQHPLILLICGNEGGYRYHG